MNSKPWYESKTILVNLVLGICAALSAVVPQLASVSAWINANASLIGMVWAGLNVVLRFVSKDAIQLGD